MKITLFVFIFYILFCVPAFSQESKKIDEFGNTNCDDYRARIDYLQDELDKISDAKGFVIVYEGDLKQSIYDKNYKRKGYKYVSSRKGIGKEVIDYFKKHLLLRRFPFDKVIFIEGGFREKFTVELWIVPDEVDPPIPSPTLKKIKQRKQKHNSFWFCGEI